MSTRKLPWHTSRMLTPLLLPALLFAGGDAHDALAAPRTPWDGRYFPNVTLVNQDGKPLRFFDDMIKDRVVLINFIFVGCHEACPLETANLRKVQEALGDRVGTDIFMYSITIDPEHDTPERLKNYATKFKVGPGWQFLTGKKEDINLLRKKLGLYREGEERKDHVASLIVGNQKTGQWRKRSVFDNPNVLATILGDDLFNYAKPRYSKGSYGQAPALTKLHPGEELFQRRCQACHTVGKGDSVGPDLHGVVDKRDRTWLTRWMKNPDKMLAEKDPLATQLFEKYQQVVMPNLQLTDQEVELLLEYMERESDKVTVARGAQKTQEKKTPTTTAVAPQ